MIPTHHPNNTTIPQTSAHSRLVVTDNHTYQEECLRALPDMIELYSGVLFLIDIIGSSGQKSKYFYYTSMSIAASATAGAALKSIPPQTISKELT